MSRNHRRTMKAFYARFGKGPWECCWCDEIVERLGRGTWGGQVHHKDGNIENDDPENLEVGHAICHMRHHLAGVPKTPEHRAKTGRKGRTITWGDKISLANRTSTERQPQRCDRCGEMISGGLGNMRQHQKGRKCVTSSPTRMASPVDLR